MIEELAFTTEEKRKTPFKNNHKKICVKCNNPFVGYYGAKQCDSCRHKEAREIGFRSHCNICNRNSHSLVYYAKTKQYLCSFCRHKKAQEIYMDRNYPLFAKTCPECKKSFETTYSTKVYCSEECKNQSQNNRVKAKYTQKKNGES